MKVTNCEVPWFLEIHMTFCTLSISQFFYLKQIFKDWTLLPTSGTELCPISRASLYLQSGDLYVSWSVKLLLVLTSTVILGSGLIEIYDQDFCSVLDIPVFRSGDSSSIRGEDSLSVYALHLLHPSFSMCISMLSLHPSHYWLCASFVTALC
jgi:hypothetical protein